MSMNNTLPSWVFELDKYQPGKLVNTPTGTGVLVAPSSHGKFYWSVNVEDGDHGPTRKCYHISDLELRTV